MITIAGHSFCWSTKECELIQYSKTGKVLVDFCKTLYSLLQFHIDWFPLKVSKQRANASWQNKLINLDSDESNNYLPYLNRYRMSLKLASC